MPDRANQPKEVVLSYFDSFAGRDPVEIASHVSPDFVNRHVAALGTGCTGHAAYLERLPNFLSDMADLKYEVQDLIEEDGRVSAAYRLTATWQGATPISIRGVQILKVHNALITERTDYWDSASFLAQADEGAAEFLAGFGIS